MPPTPPSRSRLGSDFPVQGVVALTTMCLASLAIVAVQPPAGAAATTTPLLNEVSVNPPGPDSGWEFLEVLAEPGSSLAGYSVVFLSGDQNDEPGTVVAAVDLSPVTSVGPTGIVVAAGPAIRPTLPAGADVLDLTGADPLDVVDPNKGTFALVRGVLPVVGTDHDLDDDGALDNGLAESDLVDAFGWIDGDAGDRLYGPGVQTLTQSAGSPDVAVRIEGDTTPFGNQGSWYNGDLDGIGFTPEQSSIVFSASASENTPPGALITPGAPNGATNLPPRFDGTVLRTTDVDTPVALEVSLSDDGVLLDPTVTVAVSGGTLDVAAAADLTVTGDGTAALTLSGPLDAVSAALGTASMVPTPGVEGTVVVDLVATDGILERRASYSVDVRDGGLPSLQLDPLGGVAIPDGAEISAFDADSRRAVVVAGTSASATFVDLADPLAPTVVGTLDLSAYGGSLSSVDIHGGVAAISVIAEPKTEPGTLVLADLDGRVQRTLTLGANPDMVTFTPTGRQLLVANEGEPDCVEDPSTPEPTYVDPEGSISLVDMTGPVRRLSQADVTTAGFDAFDADALRADGVRVFGPGATVAQDLEPEYIAVGRTGRTAWVTLQENNAMALVDLRRGEVTDVVPLGYADHSQEGHGLDANDRDGAIDIRTHPGLRGMYMPDSIASFTSRGRDFTVMANEGDARDWGDCLAEESRGDDLVGDGPLERLTLTTEFPYTGDPAEGVYSFGSRSFSVRDAAGALVWDSGDTIEQLSARLVPSFFNIDNEDTPVADNRSDNKGPEPEGLTTVTADGRTLALVGLERQGGIMVFDVTQPSAPTFVEYEYSTFDANNAEGDRAPEGFESVSATDSPTGRPLVLVTHEVSNTLRVYEVSTEQARPTRR
ncbi:choice-of-anchor I family protein [Jannaschia sp. R86511]|uniref:choice-of-anchor I family protein n=1 Tax=Jannaschia sp. R86511 TaxID=3093853 RepID=UPI0036D2734A